MPKAGGTSASANSGRHRGVRVLRKPCGAPLHCGLVAIDFADGSGDVGVQTELRPSAAHQPTVCAFGQQAEPWERMLAVEMISGLMTERFCS